MIVFTHRPSPRGWVFDSVDGSLSGSGRTLRKSVDSSEHVARHYLSGRQGYAVQPQDAQYQVDHVIHN